MTAFARALAALLGLAALQHCCAQPLEDVLVETYQVREQPGGQAPLITYRIFLDLAPDHRLQVVYGDEAHALRIETSPQFENSTDGSVVYGDRVTFKPTDHEVMSADSWLTIGMVGSKHIGVPRALDPDGSMLECPSFSPVDQQRLDPLCIADGLVPADNPVEVINWRLDKGYLGEVRGKVIYSNDAAWAALGGMMGATPENMVLVAQITTSGPLHFVLNVQIGTPDGKVVKVVASNPAEGELVLDALTYGIRPEH